MPRWDRELLSCSERRGVRRGLGSGPRLEDPEKVDRNEGEDAGKEHDACHQDRR
jgi:hypothetical protein